jgi:hypothetical protein
MQGGTPVYIREGRVFPGGGFGGDLREAVQGNAEAERYAKSYRTNMIAGVTTALGGVASAIVGGILYAQSSARPDNERDGTVEGVGATMAVGGVVAYVAGMVLMLNAQPHLWDAVNSYNDSVDPGVSIRGGGPSALTSINGRYAPYAPYAPVGATSFAAAPIVPSASAAESPTAAKTATANPKEAAPPSAAPAPTPDAPPGSAAPSAPLPDLDLDAVEAQ